MAEYRPIKIKIWHDLWYMPLTPHEKIVWIFLLTNDFVHISGIYELPKPLIGTFTGVNNYEKILKKFEQAGKIQYKEGWIFIDNYLKNQINQINKEDNIIKSIIFYLRENHNLIALFDLENHKEFKPLVSMSKDPTLKSKDKDKDKRVVPKETTHAATPPAKTIKTTTKTEIKKNEAELEKSKLQKETVELIDYWKTKWEKSMGKKPTITSWPRYIKQAKPLVKVIGSARMKILCDAYRSEEHTSELQSH